MLTKYKQLAESILEPAVKPLAKVNPNLLTLLGSIPSLLFFVAIVQNHFVLALFTSILHLSDLFDGMVARKYKRVTIFGGFLDSTMDRIGDFFLITPFAFAGLAGWNIVAPLLLFSFLTSYIRSRGELANPKVSFAVGIIERTERIIIIFATVLLYLLFPEFHFAGLNFIEFNFLILLLLSGYTVLQRIMHAYKKL
jgi:phosphatidylglycerophosphate synthase